MPGYGKSRAAKYLCENLRIPCISTDRIFDNFIFPESDQKKLIKKHTKYNPNIYEHFSISKFIKSNNLCIENLYKLLLDNLANIFTFYNTSTVIVEGFLGDYQSRLIGLLVDFDILEIQIIDKYVAKLAGSMFELENYQYNSLVDFISTKYYNESLNIMQTTNYQSFIGRKSSDSSSKLKCMRLNDLINKNSYVLDIGCNLGFFSFETAKLTNSDVVGIDISKKSIRKAIFLKDFYFKTYNNKFFEVNFFDLSFNSNLAQYDIIICSSTFHYFASDQKVFFKHCHMLLSRLGFLILEVELSNSSNEDIVIKQRKMDFYPCSFPSISTLTSYFSNYFEIHYHGPSVKQIGSPFDRYVFHLKKKIT